MGWCNGMKKYVPKLTNGMMYNSTRNFIQIIKFWLQKSSLKDPAKLILFGFEKGIILLFLIYKEFIREYFIKWLWFL